MNWQEYSNDNQPKDGEYVLFYVKEDITGIPFFESIGLSGTDEKLNVAVYPEYEPYGIGWASIEMPTENSFPNFRQQAGNVISLRRTTP
ncbi:hypothetical protein H0A36_29615 [Endozoicomonas sp. SM1973]|uniref:Uncharacterized protein n=1 Tax=Spartinivicinus marinus TaxID=2994442 RepID=A0A853IJI6_9GAMM|nr:hypothetical protein [Spartinivicinus marinus]NYZ70174.1 hypothetical protein [Spartinivicinus marinus]